MVKEINVVLNWAQMLGVFWLIVAVVGTTFQQIRPYLQAKIDNEKNGQLKQIMELANQLASVVVPEMAIMAGLSNSVRRKEAIRFIAEKLSDNGIQVSQETLSGIVEKAYQDYQHPTSSNNRLSQVKTPVTPPS